jgi:hypothetical protein
MHAPNPRALYGSHRHLRAKQYTEPTIERGHDEPIHGGRAEKPQKMTAAIGA